MRIIYLGLFLSVIMSNTWAFAKNADAPAAVNPVVNSISAEQKELVRRLLEANGTREQLIMAFEEIINHAPADQHEDLRALLQSDIIIDQLIPIYLKKFTITEIQSLINTFNDPVMKKYLNTMPYVMQESMKVSFDYFRAKTLEIEKKHKKTATSPQTPK